MNRDIKFKAWDKENKQLKIVSELEFLYSKTQKPNYKPQGMLSDIWLNNDNTSYFPCEVDLLQFIGLYDKNGVEIYEGDIFKDKSGEIFIVTYYNSMASFVGKNKTGQWIKIEIDYNSENSDIEVIGNIYENKELFIQVN